jgi:glycyl-tRNA synthetase alpha subunit
MRSDTSCLLLALGGTFSSAFAKCSRDALSDGVDAYLYAQREGEIEELPIVKNVSYTENRVGIDIENSIVTKDLDLDWNNTLYDTTTYTTVS